MIPERFLLSKLRYLLVQDELPKGQTWVEELLCGP